MSDAVRYEGVAVIGMAGRFPGAGDVGTLWQNLCDGRESISFFSEEELHPAVTESATPGYVKARGVLQDAEMFDAAFFGINPREAEVMDPQQRVFLELSWAALEDAGHDPATFKGLVGVYAGMANNTYYPAYVAERPDLVRSVGEFNTMLANEKDFLATRISHKLDLRGPSLSLYTGCSTSLVAIAEAFHSLMSYRCDMALAGGIAITVPQHAGYVHRDGGIESSDGHCRPFDAKGDGTVFSNGAGLVVLRRLADAVADGDRIDAVIRGAAVNNDGADKVSFAAPSADGQAEAIATAMAQAGVEPETVSYVEAHGTGTYLGDPIEFEGLKRAFGDSQGPCALGSIKSNVGHLLAAAGVAGLIKTVLALRNQKLPPTLHYASPNPEIDFGASPFHVQDRLADWPAGDLPRRAGVSSFGIGGTNAHVVLEEPPSSAPTQGGRSQQVLVLSAKSDDALKRAVDGLLLALRAEDAPDIADAAFTLQCGRRGFRHRCAVVCQTREEAIEKIALGERSEVESASQVVFMFPGQGSQYEGMGQGLYESEAVFREATDRCHDILKKLQLDSAASPQVSLFVLEYALAELWERWGVQPSAYVGHSIGELVAASRAGVLSLKDALRVLAQREKLLADLPPGGMLSVLLPAAELKERLPPGVALAAENSPTLCVVAGPVEALDEMEKTLGTENTMCRRLEAAHAFHSPLLEPLVEPLTALFADVELKVPEVPIISTVTGHKMTHQQATDPAYWARHHVEPVQFALALDTLAREIPSVLLEVGPGVQTTTFARQQSGVPVQGVVASLLESANIAGEKAAIHTAVARIWLAGVPVDWGGYHESERRRRVSLPTYPFERKRYWAGASERDAAPSAVNTGPEAGGHVLALEDSEQGERVGQATSSVHQLRQKVQRRVARRNSVRGEGRRPESEQPD